MQPQTHVCLQEYNSLAAPSTAEFFYAATDLNQLRQALAWAKQRQLPVWLLGGGSNVLCAPEINGLVLSPRLQGRQLRTSNNDEVLVEFAAGENWHQAVCWALENHYYGLENLALIPGTCGAAPIQNIGAYGLEVGDRLQSVTALNRHTGELQHFSCQQCEFGYRESAFKHQLRSSHIITSITLKLSRHAHCITHYPALSSALSGRTASPDTLFAAVCELRRSKLPDPATLPNSGSFFKNPLVPSHQLQQLLSQYPQLAHFPGANGQHKLAAAWLIEQAGWKGRSIHGVQVHAKQALVLTNPNRLNIQALLAAATAIAQSVAQRFGIVLEIEPQILGELSVSAAY